MPVKAQIITKETEITIDVMFNPTEYTFSSSLDISNNHNNLVFKTLKHDDFSVDLFFDTYEEGLDVRKEIEPIAELMEPTVEGQETKRPPICIFSWGDFKYEGIISKINQKFTMFLATGVPVRAEVSLTLTSVLEEAQKIAYSGREACRKLWTVKMGDRLDLIAHKALKDVALWREIAEANNIKNPLNFPTPNDVGRILVIPD